MSVYDRILVPTDGSECAKKAARHAVEIAEKFDAEVHAMYVIDDRNFHDTEFWDQLVRTYRENGEEATEYVASLAEERGLDVTTETEIGAPHSTIVEYADDNDIDIIVMGTHGRTGLERAFMGSVAEKVVRLANVPVTTIDGVDQS